MRKAIGPITLILHLGATIVTATLLPLLIGIGLDNQFKTAPWITLVGFGIGIITAMIAVYRTISATYKNLP